MLQKCKSMYRKGFFLVPTESCKTRLAFIIFFLSTDLPGILKSALNVMLQVSVTSRISSQTLILNLFAQTCVSELWPFASVNSSRHEASSLRVDGRIHELLEEML